MAEREIGVKKKVIKLVTWTIQFVPILIVAYIGGSRSKFSPPVRSREHLPGDLNNEPVESEGKRDFWSI